jgi:hypothetical protein
LYPINNHLNKTIMENKENAGNAAFKVTGNWDVQSKQLKNKFSQLTDADLKFEIGKEHEMLSRVETRLNKKREEVIDIIKKGETEKA